MLGKINESFCNSKKNAIPITQIGPIRLISPISPIRFINMSGRGLFLTDGNDVFDVRAAVHVPCLG